MKSTSTSALLLVFTFFIQTLAYSQANDSISSKSVSGEIRYPNIVKVNSLALAFNNISLIYERGIIPRVSAGIGVGYKYKGAAPSFLNLDNSLIRLQIDDIKGFSITPEAKYYLRACDPGKLEGFYAGLYFRYTHYNTGADFRYLPQNNSQENYNASLAMNEFGVGIQLGYQIIIKERFSIDFLFIGPRYSSCKLGYEFDPAPSQEFLDDLSDALNEVVDRLGFDYNVDIRSEGLGKASSSFSFANMRFGISLGYTF